MTKDEKAEDYDRLSYEYTQLNQELKSQKRANKKLQEQFLLHNVSQQRELLVAYEKQHYTPSEWALASKQCEKEIDDFLATNCG